MRMTNILNPNIKAISEHLILNLWMYAFTYWHTYYDSAFLSHPFKLSQALYIDLEITSVHLLKWPFYKKLPQLPKLYEYLEQFILDGHNWTGCMCKQIEIDKIQREINTLVLHLQCEKRYGIQFWEKSKRRVQASIVHFVIFIKRLVFLIIPEGCKNLIQAMKIEKLAIEMLKFENFMNQIIKNIKPIHQFLNGVYFSEQKQLTKQFFQEFNDLIINLPKLKKSTLNKIPKLMEYICVLNPIQAEEYQHERDVSLRRKNATVSEKPKHMKKYSLDKQSDISQQNFKMLNTSMVKTKQKKLSLQKNPFIYTDKKEIKNWTFFRFNEKVRKHSVYNKPKKLTVASLQTKQKNSSVQKQRSPSQDRSLTIISNPIKLKSRTLANDIRQKQESLSINPRSRQLTAKSIMSRKSIKKLEDFEGEQIQHQRQQKAKKKKVIKLPVKTNNYSQQLNLNDGKVKGWAVIRQYIKKRIIQRKIKKLMQH